MHPILKIIVSAILAVVTVFYLGIGTLMLMAIWFARQSGLTNGDVSIGYDVRAIGSSPFLWLLFGLLLGLTALYQRILSRHS